MDAATEQLMENLKAYQDILLSAHTEVIYAKASIQRVRELHKPYEWDNHIECVICPDTEYPCETIKALNGGTE